MYNFHIRYTMNKTNYQNTTETVNILKIKTDKRNWQNTIMKLFPEFYNSHKGWREVNW